MQNLEMIMKIASATLFSFYLKSHMIHFNIIGPNFFNIINSRMKSGKILLKNLMEFLNRLEHWILLLPHHYQNFKNYLKLKI